MTNDTKAPERIWAQDAEPNARADCIRQHRLIAEALGYYHKALKGGDE